MRFVSDQISPDAGPGRQVCRRRGCRGRVARRLDVRARPGPVRSGLAAVASAVRLGRGLPSATLHCGDCLALLAAMEPASVDVVVTSPPYNLGIAYAAYDDARAEADYLDWMEAVVTGLRRVMRPDGSFFLNIAGSSTQPWLPFELIVRLRRAVRPAEPRGLGEVDRGLAAKGAVGHNKPVRRDPFPEPQPRARVPPDADRVTCRSTGWRSACRSATSPTSPAAAMRRTSVAGGTRGSSRTPTVQSRSEKFHHPGTFPLDLPRWCIRLHGKPGAAVLDPFAGAGTTLLAAQAEGAHGIGIEIDPAYVATAQARLAAAAAARWERGTVGLGLDPGVLDGARDVERRRQCRSAPVSLTDQGGVRGP